MQEAIDILKDIPFVDGTEEKIKFCRQRMEEIEEEKTNQLESERQNDVRSTKIGIVIIIVLVVFSLLLAAGVCFLLYKCINGECSPVIIYIIIGLVVLTAVTAFVKKRKV